MRGITSSDKASNPENTAPTTDDTTSTTRDSKNDTENNDAANNNTEPDTNGTLNDALVVADKLAATVEARKLLSTKTEVPIDDFIEAGVLEAVKMNLEKSRLVTVDAYDVYNSCLQIY